MTRPGIGTRPIRLLALLLALTTSACAGGTGTGSSGLIGTEGALVARVVESGECEEFGGVDYCPADAPEALPSGKYISTPFDEQTSIGCFRSESGSALCVFVFSFEPQGFAANEEFVVALRDSDSEEPWDLFSLREPLTEEEEEADLIVTSIVIDLADEAGEQIQLGILAFPEPVDDLPLTTASLAELGAEAVFLAPPLDAIPELTDEDGAIAEARASQSCVTAGVVAFCPVDVTFEAGKLEPALGPPPFPATTRLELGVTSPVLCTLEVGGSRCTAEIEFTVLGEIGIYYRMATRVGNSDWRLGEEVEEPLEIDIEVPRPFTATATVELIGVDTSAPVEIDLAILVDPLDPIDLPSSLPTLNEAVPVYTFLPGPLLLDVVP